MSNEAVYRTAPATPGLLNIKEHLIYFLRIQLTYFLESTLSHLHDKLSKRGTVMKLCTGQTNYALTICTKTYNYLGHYGYASINSTLCDPCTHLEFFVAKLPLTC